MSENTAQRSDYIDFARGYAILTVALYHAMQQAADLPAALRQAITFGGTGVHLFFLLSGYGLALSKSGGGTLDFYRRRLDKVWLPYAVALTLSWCAGAAFGIFDDDWRAWMAGITLYSMFSERYIQSFGGHFWFIGAIFQFYLVFPLLRRGADGLRSPWVFWLITLMLSALWWCWVAFTGRGEEQVWRRFFMQYVWEFALGMALANGMLGGRSGIMRWWLPQKWWIWAILGVAFSGLMLLLTVKGGEKARIFNDVPALAGYGALSVAVYGFCRMYFDAGWRFFTWVGKISYGYYLIHVLVLMLLTAVLRRFGMPFTMPVTLVFVPLSLLAGWLFERGMIGFRKLLNAVQVEKEGR